VAAAAPSPTRKEPSAPAAAGISLLDDDDGPRVEKPEPIIVPSEGVAEAPQRSARSEDEGDESVPPGEHAPDPQAEVPVVVVAPADGKAPAAGAQPWRGQGERAWDWDDLADKKYWALWLGLFALYPLLKRRPGAA
jgi:hypothetical protein